MSNTQVKKQDEQNVGVDTKKQGEQNVGTSSPGLMVRTVRQIKNVCQHGDMVQVKAMIGKSEVREQAGGKKYMILEIQDSTGVVSAKIWSDSYLKMTEPMRKTLLAVSAENPVCAAIGGFREEFAGTPYINVKGLNFREGDDPKNYVPSTDEDEDAMFEYIIDCVDSIDDPFRTILINKLKDKENEFKNAPAAKRYHDNFRAGLLEHTFKMLKSYVQIANLYNHINKTIMIFLIIQHDFEKINGYTLLPTIEWTDQEELVGHQVMGAINVYNELKAHDVDDTTIMAILNAIIAHHGKAEWGAAKPAMTIEARLLAHLDYMISDIAKANQTIEDKGSEQGKIDRDLFFAKY